MPTPRRFVPFCVSLVLSLAIYGTMVFCLLCPSFWLIKMRNFFWLIYNLAEFAKYPCRGVSRCDKGPSHHGAPVGAPLPLPGDGVGGAWRHGTPRISARGTRGFLFLGRSLWRAGLRRYRGAGG
ncbi:ABC-2 family transporter protein [Candidatus Bipolaricaulota bacterium]|nr:ABC-2 family transporter protein [Candidatus Bipolaricaulota bacterium]